jgi:hypothetical protein
MRVFTGVLVFLFGVSSTQSMGLEFDPGVPVFLKEQVEGDLQFADSVRNTRVSKLHREIFGSAGQGEALHWFDSRVSYFGYGDCGGSATAVACVQGRNDRKIWVTRNYVEIEHPQVARVMTLFHEARHTEGHRRNWPHSRCSPFFKHKSIWTGSDLRWHFACDRTEYGSYGSASVLLNNISRFCSNCTEKVRRDAAIYSEDQVKRIVRRSASLRIKADFRE